MRTEHAMFKFHNFSRVAWLWLWLLTAAAVSASAQQTLTWEQVRLRFEQNNPTLLAGKLNVDESKASEITAYLRPNPDMNLLIDQINVFSINPFQPFSPTLATTTLSYLHERRHKRELRLESAKDSTAVATSTQADLERTLLFTLRGAFIQTLQAKAVLGVTRENLAYYDKVLEVSRDRFHAGDIAQVDLDRLELQRVQYESDLQSAEVSLRTAKIQMLALLNDRTPIEQFAVTGPYEFSEQVQPLDDLRQIALDTRPDLQAATESVEKAKAEHKLAVANGSTDPTFAADGGLNPPINHYIGFGVTFPLRIFDRNQGEKLRTQLEIERNSRLLAASQAQVFNDVDSAYATLSSNLALLHPYKEKYLEQAVRVRDTIAFSYQHGGASLLDFLSAQGEYRTVQLAYVNLVGSYLSAASQLNLAVGREVIP
jgi:cobalt-zinc-cadmium efflux system outer membrane protein